jgi:hypothetical protein
MKNFAIKPYSMGRILSESDSRKSRIQKKAAWFPRRPFLSRGSSTLTGDFRISAPGAYLPAAF